MERVRFGLVQAFLTDPSLETVHRVVPNTNFGGRVGVAFSPSRVCDACSGSFFWGGVIVFINRHSRLEDAGTAVMNTLKADLSN